VDAPDGIEAWLASHPHGPGRRVARITSRGVLVSKFEPGFFERLDATLTDVPALFDIETVRAAYRAAAAPGVSRAEAWRLGVSSLLDNIRGEGRIDARQHAEAMAGVDSVSALLDAALWTDPGATVEWTPTSAEIAALDELAQRLAPDGDLFTRHYGSFEGTPVTNHCPGSRYARRFFEMARTIVTGPGPGAA
jgi:hypothetical protein